MLVTVSDTNRTEIDCMYTSIHVYNLDEMSAVLNIESHVE
jgi:hypothetical protein